MTFEEFAKENNISYDEKEYKNIKRMLELTILNKDERAQKLDLACMSLAKEAGEAEYIEVPRGFNQYNQFNHNREESIKTFKDTFSVFEIFVKEEAKMLFVYGVKAVNEKISELETELEALEKKRTAADTADVKAKAALEKAQEEAEKSRNEAVNIMFRYNNKDKDLRAIKSLLKK